jgi:uncharacterized membrane protein YfcA
MKSAPGFLKNLLILTVLVAILGALLFMTLLKEYYLDVFPFLLAFFALVTLVFHMIIERSFRKNPEKFSYVFMGLSAGKLVAILVMIVIYLIIRRETVIPFLVGTFLLYLVFTLFEVKTLLRLVQGKK